MHSLDDEQTSLEHLNTAKRELPPRPKQIPLKREHPTQSDELPQSGSIPLGERRRECVQ